MKELYEKIRDAAFNFRKAMSNGVTPRQQIEQMKNLLYNNLDGIEKALEFAAKNASDVEVLTLELADAEAEIARLTDELKAKGGKGRKNGGDANA